jgi:chorismate--pyruvate lyase
LTDSDSLTARLIAHFPDFHVRLLRQTWLQPHYDELRALRMRNRQLAVVRDVVLMSGDTPLVYAHSVMPRFALLHGFRGLRRQGEKSLGATLFANPLVQRSKLAVRAVDARHPLHVEARDAVGALPDRLWARRSRFELCHSAILVTEVFLPAVCMPLRKHAEQFGKILPVDTHCTPL